jgi:molybdenum cofactor cytidylyltransferase
MGRPKQLIRLHGETLLHRAARMALEAGCDPVVVVLGSHAPDLRPQLEGLATAVLINKDWEEGMASSLRCGMAPVAALPDLAGVLVLVCDQPLLSVDHLKNLIARHSGGQAKITASSYAGKTGVPAVFGPTAFDALLALQGDGGAREMIRAHPDQVETVAWAEGALDLDLPADAEQIGAQ